MLQHQPCLGADTLMEYSALLKQEFFSRRKLPDSQFLLKLIKEFAHQDELQFLLVISSS